MIDYLFETATQTDAQQDLVLGLFYDSSASKWRTDVCLLNVTVTTTPSRSGFHMIVSQATRNAALEDHPAMIHAIDRDQANAAGSYVVKSRMSTAQQSSLTMSPRFAGSTYSQPLAQSITSSAETRKIAGFSHINNTQFSTSDTDFTFRMAVPIGRDVSDLVFCFDNWFLTNFGVEANGAQAMTIQKLALEKDGTSSFAPILFGGQRSTTLAVGATDVQSDALLPSAFSLGSFARDALYWLRGHVTIASGSFVAGCYCPFAGGAAGYTESAANYIDEVDGHGALTVPAASTQRYQCPGPSAIIGTPTNGAQKSVVVTGDSIADGNNDLNTVLGPGFATRAAMNAEAFSSTLPMILATKAGASYTNFNPGTKWEHYLRYADVLLDEFGTNDMPPGFNTLSATQGRAKQVWSTGRNYGCTKVVRTKLGPYTTSSDSWATLGNQSIQTSWGSGGNIDQFNTWADGLVGTTLDAVVQMNDMRASSPDNFKWPVTGAANYATPDGLHPKNPIAILMGADTRTVLASV